MSCMLCLSCRAGYRGRQPPQNGGARASGGPGMARAPKGKKRKMKEKGEKEEKTRKNRKKGEEEKKTGGGKRE